VSKKKKLFNYENLLTAYRKIRCEAFDKVSSFEHENYEFYETKTTNTQKL